MALRPSVMTSLPGSSGIIQPVPANLMPAKQSHGLSLHRAKRTLLRPASLSRSAKLGTSSTCHSSALGSVSSQRDRRSSRCAAAAPPTATTAVLQDGGSSDDEEGGGKEAEEPSWEAKAVLAADRARLEAKLAVQDSDTSGNGAVDAAISAAIALCEWFQQQGAPPPEEQDPKNYNGIYAELAGKYDSNKLAKFFEQRPWEVALRLLEMTKLALKIRHIWQLEEDLPADQRTRGDVLRGAVSQLGPVFVKCGQTLAQRGDLIGKEASKSLKALQSSNKPFEDELAWQTILEDLDHDGPLSPDCPVYADHPGKPLFAKFNKCHIASASLGQVYKAETWEGQDIALKVLRPNVLKQVALDMYVLRLGLELLKRVWNMTTDLQPIADEVGNGIFKELDYHLEAKNAEDFNRAHSFLGYVRAPKFIPKYTGPKGTARVLALEWIDGKHISDLEPDRAKLMVAMAVEASVAQLLRTGFVHVDPHEGNMMFTDDDELCFIDFGLMARVDPINMEAFASGVCHMLAGKYYELTYDFQECGIAPKAGFTKFAADGVSLMECSREEYGNALKKYMQGEADGNTRFGALATGLAQMSSHYKLETPPYIILLCRTFLTLEGIAAKVEPNFSIYTAALPFAVRRALSPETPRGVEALRAALLDDKGNFRFSYFSSVLEQTETLSKPGGKEDIPDMSPSRGAAGAKPQSGAETLTGLLGSSDGQPLRRVAKEVNTLEVARTLTSREGKTLRRQASRALGAAVLDSMDEGDEEDVGQLSPAAKVQRNIREKEQLRMKRAMKVIATAHLNNLTSGGPKGWLALVGLVLVAIRVVIGAFLHIVQDDIWTRLKSMFSRNRKGKQSRDSSTPPPSSPTVAGSTA